MKHTFMRYSLTMLVIGLAALANSQAYVRDPVRRHIDLQSLSWGMTQGQTARLSVAHFLFADGSVRTTPPSIARIQLLDMEGEVIAQSDEISVAPGKIRFWDVPRESLRAGESTGRLQLRARIRVTTSESEVNRSPLAPSVEIFDSGTGRTVLSLDVFLKIEGVPGESED